MLLKLALIVTQKVPKQLTPALIESEGSVVRVPRPAQVQTGKLKNPVRVIE